MILLDTDVLIEILEKRSRTGEEMYQAVISNGDAIGTTAINLHELLFGLRKYAKPIKEIFQLPVIDYTADDARLSSQIELDMDRLGRTVRRTDTMIAAIAINRSMKLLTLNTKHFKPISEKTSLKLFS